jgi:RNA polymerase sigma-70 factor (ECF subfamily)
MLAGPDRETTLLTAARDGDERAFAELVAPYRSELLAAGYRMLGSHADAEDALQEALLGAWKGLRRFEGRSSLRTWLHRIATHAALRLIEKRPKRQLSWDHGPACRDVGDLGEPVGEPVWFEPWLEDPAADYERRETLELAYAAALQHLPANQRAVLVLREVLAFSAAEVAQLLDTSVASVNSALQRARAAVAERVPQRSQAAELAALGDAGTRELAAAFVTAWERADLDALLDLLTADVRFTMPPLLAWFDGRDAVARFLAERVFATPWRLLPLAGVAGGQLAFACYQGQPEPDGQPVFSLGSINVLGLRDGRICWLAGFLDPALLEKVSASR